MKKSTRALTNLTFSLFLNGRVKCMYHICSKCYRQIDDDDYYRDGLCSTCRYT